MRDWGADSILYVSRRKVECQRTDAFKLWCWKRLLRVPWRARRSNQSILKEINPEYSLEGLLLKLQSFGHLIERANSLEKTLMLRNTECKRKMGQQRMRGLDSITNLEKTLESPLDSREIKIVNTKGAQSWISLEGLMLKLKLQLLWPLDADCWIH